MAVLRFLAHLASTSTLTQIALALITTSTISLLVALQKPVPNEYVQAWLLILGWYFGRAVTSPPSQASPFRGDQDGRAAGST